MKLGVAQQIEPHRGRLDFAIDRTLFYFTVATGVRSQMLSSTDPLNFQRSRRRLLTLTRRALAG